MSTIKDRAKMFSKDPSNHKDLKKDLIPKEEKKENKEKYEKKEKKEEEVNDEIGLLAKFSWSNFNWSKKKILIVAGIALSIIVVITIIIIIASSSKSSSSSSNPSDQNNPNDPSKQDDQKSDSKDKQDSKEIDIDSYIKPDCTGVCSKPYDILVYNDNVLKAKLKECGYTEGSQLFNYALSAIKRHNVVRACHNANPLMFNCEIMKIAQDYSQYLATQVGTLQHSGTEFHGEWMGENLAYVGGSNINISGERPTNMWYNEVSNYNFNNPGFSSGTGHFTQVVWKNSKEFGIGLYCQNNKCFMTGNYYPGGNFGYNNDYARNVQNLQ